MLTSKGNFQFIFKVLGIVFLFQVSGMFSPETFGQKKKAPAGNSFHTAAGVYYSNLNINNVSTFVYNNGIADVNPSQDAGFIYPKGSNKPVFYCTGILWGGLNGGVWSVGGASTKSGLIAGGIKQDGTPEDPAGDGGRIYRVRSDYKAFSDMASMNNLYAAEISNEGKTADQIYQDYDKDWKEWPVQKGAPFIDADNDGLYNPDVDIPGMSSEPSQTIWFAANDLNTTAVQNLYGSLPMRIELQTTVWAIKTTGGVNNTIFRRSRFINKSQGKFDSMYVCMYTDSDIGDAYDDFAGVDTNLSFGFTYNAQVNDAVYGNTPPAAGVDIFQSPRIPGNTTDSTVFKGRYVFGWKGVGINSFIMFSRNVTADWSEPALGTYASALKWKNLFQGKMASSGTLYTDPNTGRKTKFPLGGDPTTGAGWVDGQLHPKNDRVTGIVSGPFTMNAGDTQEVVSGQIAGGGTPGVNNIAAVSVLKFYDRTTQSFFDLISGKPSPPVLTAGTQITATEIPITWSANSVYSYRLDVARDNAFTDFLPAYKSRKINTGIGSHTITGLTGNTTFYVRIRAYNAGLNHSVNSNTLSVTTSTSGIEQDKSELPKEIILRQNYPNPFNPVTKIEYSLPKECRVKIEIYNSIGQLVEVIANEIKSAGIHNAVFNGTSFSSGVYIIKMSAIPSDGSPMRNLSRRMVLLK